MRLTAAFRCVAALAALSITALSPASAQVLWDNGPVVNGAGISEVRPGGSLIGLGAQTIVPNVVADDFTVGPSGWNVSGFNFFAYQTDSNGVFTFTGLNWRIVSGDINVGPTVASGSAVPTNGGLLGYRTLAGAQSSTERPIFQLDVDVVDFSLGAGDYWLTWDITGVGDPARMGPWQPPTSDGSDGNAMQSLANAPFSEFVEGGTQLGVELPFIIQGTTGAEVPEPSSLAMLFAGGVAMMGLARRRRSVP